MLYYLFSYGFFQKTNISYSIAIITIRLPLSSLLALEFDNNIPFWPTKHKAFIYTYFNICAYLAICDPQICVFMTVLRGKAYMSILCIHFTYKPHVL